MSETTAALLPWIALLTKSAIAGALAARLFGIIRARTNREWLAQNIRFPAVWALSWLLYSPLGALLSALTLAGLISGLAEISLSALTGGDVLATVDAATAALLSAILSQIAYRLGIGEIAKQ